MANEFQKMQKLAGLITEAQLNENISDKAIERMEGLANTSHLSSLKFSLENFAKCYQEIDFPSDRCQKRTMTTLFNEKTKLLSKKENKKETLSQRSYEEVLEKLEKEASLVEEEPPALHEAVAEARYQAWKEGKITSRKAEEVFKDLLAKASKKRSL